MPFTRVAAIVFGLSIWMISSIWETQLPAPSSVGPRRMRQVSPPRMSPTEAVNGPPIHGHAAKGFLAEAESIHVLKLCVRLPGGWVASGN